jgi:hypothetical protein
MEDFKKEARFLLKTIKGKFDTIDKAFAELSKSLELTTSNLSDKIVVAGI